MTPARAIAELLRFLSQWLEMKAAAVKGKK